MATHVGWGRSSRTRSHRPRKGRVGVARNRRGVVVGVADVAGRDPRREERRGSRNRPDSPRSPREPLAVGCCAAHTDASSPQQRCGDRIHHPLKSIAAPGDWGSRCDNAVIITVAGVDPSSIRQSSMSGTVYPQRVRSIPFRGDICVQSQGGVARSEVPRTRMLRSSIGDEGARAVGRVVPDGSVLGADR